MRLQLLLKADCRHPTGIEDARSGDDGATGAGLVDAFAAWQQA